MGRTATGGTSGGRWMVMGGGIIIGFGNIICGGRGGMASGGGGINGGRMTSPGSGDMSGVPF
jgi:hypothetical protein